MTGPRVRFAPSPTGHLHVGGARTALFNYLFARHEGGEFLLRIEDTDRERSTPEMTAAILEAMQWLGLEVDEEPVFQAQGLERHTRDVDQLLKTHAAYRCFCTADELKQRREAAKVRGEPYRYDWRCRELPRADADRRAEAGEPYSIRFAVPMEGEVAWDDLVHGPTRFANENLDDFIIRRSDGTPVYNLAVVSDDIAMRISHVLRGDDHISNTPKQILLYRALGHEPPEFAHLPMILGADGKRLSKRHGAASVDAHRDVGILPEAMVNFLALLGWSPGDDREVMDLPELIEAFDVARILKKSAVFDPRKLEWLNGQHISRMDADRLVEAVEEALTASGDISSKHLAVKRDRLIDVIHTVKERARTLDELVAQARPFFATEITYDEKAVGKHWKDREATANRLAALADRFSAVGSFEPEALEEALRGLADELEVSAAKLIHPLRVALMGVAVSPGIFDVVSRMGRERTLERIARAREYLAAESDLLD